MKKDYIKPEMVEEVLFTQNFIAASLSDEEADDSQVLGRGRRGSWGNLWDED
ncbi:MAG: hypothetical protein IK000_02205 [Bacteroidaceae bacterium]|nr:hypothetical protein [Bacteroidaceae bacterium]